MILYLVRHGATEWTATRRCQGHTDVPLSEEGREQARALGRRLAALGVDAVYTSDLARARETADLALREAGSAASPTPDPRLREMRFGRWEGLTTAELEAAFPDERERWRRDPEGLRPGGGESLAELQARVVAVYEELRVRHGGERVLVVGHGYALLCLVCHVLDVPVARFRRFWLDATGLCEVRDDGRDATLRCLNDTGHLEAGRRGRG